MRQKLFDLLQLSFNSFMSNIHTAIPGKIESYNAIKKQAEVKPLIKKQFEESNLEYPVISNVPVMLPGNEESVISIPLQKGDGCLILFSEVSLERYLSSSGEIVEVGDVRKFSLSDAICIPGLGPFNKPGKIGNGTDFEVIYKNGNLKITSNDLTLNYNNAQIKLTGSNVEISYSTAKIILSNTLIEIDGSGTVIGITLKSGDALIWQPNILPVDPITGVPHGGPGAGIVKLKGA